MGVSMRTMRGVDGRAQGLHRKRALRVAQMVYRNELNARVPCCAPCPVPFVPARFALTVATFDTHFHRLAAALSACLDPGVLEHDAAGLRDLLDLDDVQLLASGATPEAQAWSGEHFWLAQPAPGRFVLYLKWHAADMAQRDEAQRAALEGDFEACFDAAADRLDDYFDGDDAAEEADDAERSAVAYWQADGVRLRLLADCPPAGHGILALHLGALPEA